MQYGPGAENAFPGVATAYSDSTPLLLLPLGHTRQQDRVLPLFSSLRTYESVTKSVEQMNTEERVVDVMRRAFASLRNGRGGPVMVEIPADLTNATVDSSIVDNYRPVPTVLSQADPEDVEKAAQHMELELSRPKRRDAVSEQQRRQHGETEQIAEERDLERVQLGGHVADRPVHAREHHR